MNGVVNLIKPCGVSSQWAVNAVKRILEVKKAGHTGTLDPGAEGVLPVCIGKATKLFDYFTDKTKEYVAEITFGIQTDTLDSFGSIVATSDKVVARHELERVLMDFTGEIEQTPPLYSAISVNGERLYKKALKGETPEIPARIVSIYECGLVSKVSDNRYLIRVVCGKGTYIRSLCRDIGAALDTCANMSLLIRTKSGGFNISDAVTLEGLKEAKETGTQNLYIKPIETLLGDMPSVVLPNEFERSVLNGNAIWLKHAKILDGPQEKAQYRLYCNGFKGIASIEDDKIKINKLLV